METYMRPRVKKGAVAPHPENRAPAAPPERVEWKPLLDCYREKRALTFKSRKEIDKAIDLLWTEELILLPHALAGGDTIIVPAEAVPYFKAKGLTFSNTRVLSAAELPPGNLDVF